MSVRQPAVAGTFYPADKLQLEQLLKSCFVEHGGPGSLPTVNLDGPRRVTAFVSPHAGLIYSGSVAAWDYYRMAQDGVPEIAVILSPNHRSHSPAAALSGDESWLTPLGEMPVDLAVTEEIAAKCPEAEIDSYAHHAEHSIEIQIPFLQYISQLGSTRTRIVPIMIGSPRKAAPIDFVRDLGSCIGDTLKGKNAVLIASTDFTHFEPGDIAQRKDNEAISSILGMDEEGLICTVEARGISMCGVLPTATAIVASKRMGGLCARQLAYRNSGDVTGDYSGVVGYAAIEISR